MMPFHAIENIVLVKGHKDRNTLVEGILLGSQRGLR